jgi:hypothetical protein
MKRKFLALFLTAYLIAFATPFIAAAETTTSPKICTFDSYEFDSSSSVASEDEGYQAWAATFEKQYATMYDSSTCGLPNKTTNLLEKGDCSMTDPNDPESKAKIITEISEPIAPNVTLDKNTQVITVYQGECCLSYSTSSGVITCNDVRTIYADTYSNCTDNGINCNQRQWLIASSGIGLLKLFVKQVYTWGAFSVGSIAVGTIIFQGIKISLSGVSGDVSEAKTKIFQAIAGIVLLFVSSLILYTINPDFFS